MTSLKVEAAAGSLGFSAARLDRIKPFFDRYVDEGKLPGWQATIARGGELAWCATSGTRDRERGLAVEDDTIWWLYSMTKPLTAVAVMMLYEEGLFDLNDDVGRWIDSLREPRVWAGGTPTSPLTVPAEGPVRVHHLLTHMSGLTYGFTYLHPVDAIYRAKGYDFGFSKGATLAEAVDDWCTSPLVFQPGTRWNYSVGFDVLGRLIEIWSGQALDVFMKERVLDPLGMTDTEWWCPPEKQDRLGMLYWGNDGAAFPLEDLAKHAWRPQRILGGGGGLMSTAADYQRFMTMLLRGGELDGVRLLSNASVALMVENHLPEDQDLVAMAEDSYTEAAYDGLGFGFSMAVVNDRRKNKSLISEGSYFWSGAASTLFWVDPVEELTVAFYTNVLPSGTYPLRRELQTLVYQALSD